MHLMVLSASSAVASPLCEWVIEGLLLVLVLIGRVADLSLYRRRRASAKRRKACRPVRGRQK
jgi:hypothetical protein